MISLPLIVDAGPQHLRGAEWEEVARFSGDAVRQIEGASIRAFMETHRQMLTGRVLDFGAGKQPYRDLVSGEYVPYEKGEQLPGGYFDAVMCNQVVQYLDNPEFTLSMTIQAMLKPGGRLVMTYPTSWDEVEPEDKWRFTKSGMEKLLERSGFQVLEHELRAAVVIGGRFRFPLGYGVVAVWS